MTVGHFPPFFKNLSEWRWDIFLLFVKTCHNVHGTISSFLWKLVRMYMGHFPPFLKISQNDQGTFSSFLWNFLKGFPKKEENVPLSFWQVFTKRRKMSHLHSDKFSKKGGKCLTVIPTHFYKKEENVLLSFQQVFTKRRKMLHNNSDKFSKKGGGKCPYFLLPSFRYGRKIFLKALWEI